MTLYIYNLDDIYNKNIQYAKITQVRKIWLIIITFIREKGQTEL